ncbi:MAG: hypothetical protein QF918_13370 [Pirellulaceae bacterium]|nr:hypothetical protein [Pirellulaceae bacterium]MDP6557040.1 hypothetical protein [Pirellulaceae bacterium]
MSSGFDPYSEWLDLKASTGPLDHYQLLGLPRFEQDATVIADAADRALSRVRSHRPGVHSQAWAQLLDQITAAKTCLANASLRADYDRSLGQDSWGQDTASGLSANASPSPQPDTPTAVPNSESPTNQNTTNQNTNPAGACSGPAATPVPGFVPPHADPMAPVGVPTPQSGVPASPIPGFANLPTSNPGLQSQAMMGQAVPAADPMAPLETASAPQSQIPADPVQNVPMPGFANLAPHQNPMAPAASPIVQSASVPMAQPVGMAQPAMAQPVSESQAPAHVESPSAMTNAVQATAAIAADVSPDQPPRLGAKRSATAMAKSRSQTGIMTPILVGVAVGLLLLFMGALYWFMGDPGESDIATQTHPAYRPFVSQAATTSASGEPSGLPSGRSGENVDPDASGTTGPPPASVPAPSPEPDPPAMEDSPAPEPTSPEPTPPEPTPPEPTPPEPTPTPMPPQPSPAELVQLSTKLKSARAALAKHDFAAAKTILDSAEPLIMLEAHQSKFDRLRQATEYAADYHDAITAGTSKLQAGEALQVKGNSVGIVEASADHVVLRIGGMNKRYELSNLPLGLAVVLAHQAVSPTDARTIAQKACYVVTSPAATADDKTKARDWFLEAAAGLPAVADLADFLEDDYDLVVDVVTPTEMPDSPTTTDPANKPTRQEVMQLATALSEARKAIMARDLGGAETQLTAAEPFAKRADHKQKLWRLQRLAEHIRAFDEAMKEAIAALNPGDVIKVGSSTEITVERINPASLAVQVVGLKKTYPLDNPPLGLAVALVQTKLSPDDPVTKAVLAAFVVASRDSDDRTLAKARAWYEESAAGNPDYANLGDVIDDDYNLLEDFQEE